MCHKVLLQVVWPGVRRHSVPAETEVVTEAVTEAVTEVVTEAVTEVVTEVVTEAVTEVVTEAVLARQSGLHLAVAEIFNLHSAPAGDRELVLSTL